jgi:hypothetical protein
VARIGGKRNTHTPPSPGKSERKRPIERSRRRGKDNRKIYLI